MMNELVSALSLTALGIFLFFPYNSFRVDKMRQKTFALRDELFDEARAGKISFDSRAYGATRSLLNGVIRYSHRISFSRLIACRFLMTHRAVAGATDGLIQAMNASSAEDRKLCSHYIMRVDVIVLEHIFSSPFVLIFIVPQVVGIVLSKIGFDFAERLVKTWKRQFANFNQIAFREGSAIN